MSILSFNWLCDYLHVICKFSFETKEKPHRNPKNGFPVRLLLGAAMWLEYTTCWLRTEFRGENQDNTDVFSPFPAVESSGRACFPSAVTRVFSGMGQSVGQRGKEENLMYFKFWAVINKDKLSQRTALPHLLRSQQIPAAVRSAVWSWWPPGFTSNTVSIPLPW